jgi:hypothetical protein
MALVQKELEEKAKKVKNELEEKARQTKALVVAAKKEADDVWNAAQNKA